MRGETSLISDHAAREKFAAAIRDKGEDAVQEAAQLFDFTQTLDDNPQLEADLTDPARSQQTKTQIVGDMLRQAGATDLTVEIVCDLVSRPWSKSAHLANGVEDLGIDCVLYAADAKGVIQQVSFQLAQINSAVLNLPTVRSDLSDPRADPDERVRLLRTIFAGNSMDPLTRMLAEHATRSLRGRRFVPTIRWMIGKISHHLGAEEVTVTAAVPLSDTQVERLRAVFAKRLGHPVRINTIVDPSVIGGMRMRAGSLVIDNTVVAQLRALHARLDEAKAA